MSAKDLLSLRLRIVVLESPFQNWGQAQVPELFKNVIDLKKWGYDGYYPFGFLPVDSTDFVGTHHLICQESDSALTPIAGFRSITLQQCENFHLRFPGKTALENDRGTEPHQAAVQQIIERISAAGQTLSFGSSWTIHPLLRGDREKIELLKDIARAMLFSYQTEFGMTEELGLGVPKVKTDVYFSELGYEPLKLQGTTLPNFNHADIGNQVVTFLHRVNFTAFAHEAAQRHQILWKNKIYFECSASALSETKKTAA